MLRCLYPFRRLLATTFLAVFVNVLLGQCWCAGMRPTAQAQGQPTARPGAMLPNHACCRAAAERKAGKAMAQSRKSSSERHSGGGGDCCRKKSASLLAGLDAAGKQLTGPAVALLPAVPVFHFPASWAGQWDRTAAVRLVPMRHLPPKIPDIRIFIRSLTV